MLLARRVWETLHEPRVVSLLQATAYAVMSVGALALLLSPRPTTADVAVACLAIITGGAIAAAAAWRGWWDIEKVSAGIVILGLGTLTVEDAFRVLTTDKWFAWPAFVTIALILGLIQRLTYIRGRMWEPGKEPASGLATARRRVQVAAVLEADALERHRERQH